MKVYRSAFIFLAASLLLATTHEVALAEDVALSNWGSFDSPGNPMSIRFPPGWAAASDAATGRVDVRNEAGASLSVLPFFIANQTVESLNPKQFFETLIKMFAPNETWSEPSAVGANSFRSTYRNDAESASAAIVLAPAQNGVAGQVCIAKVPKAADVSTDTFAAMLDSIKYKAAPANREAPPAVASDTGADFAPQQTLQPRGGFTFNGWTRFTDPAESSFSLDVPAGWKVEGRLDRVSALDVRPWVKAVSPDDLVTAFIGDGKISPCTMPTATGNALGFRTGSNYNGTVVLPYIPARQFAEKYARSNLDKFISNLTVVEEHNHPDVAAAVNGTVGATKSEAASIKLTGMYGNIPAVAYYLAVTKATVAHGTGMWWVTKLAGVVGPANRDAEALAVILHMLQSFEVNPDWSSNSLRNTAAVSRHYTQASQQISRSISDRYWSQQAHNERMNQAYWNRQASQDRAANNFSNYIRGVENVQDPGTGTKYQVQYGPAGHYIDPTGNYYVGADHGAPAPDWRQLISVP